MVPRRSSRGSSCSVGEASPESMGTSMKKQVQSASAAGRSGHLQMVPAVAVSLAIGLVVFLGGSYLLWEHIGFPEFSELSIVDGTSITRITETSYYNKGKMYQLHIALDSGATVDYLSWWGRYPHVKEAFADISSVRLWIGTWNGKPRLFQVESRGEIAASYDQVCRRQLRDKTVGVALLGGLVATVVYYAVGRRSSSSHVVHR